MRRSQWPWPPHLKLPKPPRRLVKTWPNLHSTSCPMPMHVASSQPHGRAAARYGPRIAPYGLSHANSRQPLSGGVWQIVR